MPDQPLQAFSPPTELFTQLHLTSLLSASGIMTWVLYIAFFLWAVDTIIAIYHWLKYSHASLIALPAIGAHLFISFALMAYTLSGTGYLSRFLP